MVKITGQTILIITMALLFGLYVLSYLANKVYLRENFQFPTPMSRWTDIKKERDEGNISTEEEQKRKLEDEQYNTVISQRAGEVVKPYLQNPIDDLGDYDDYEMNVIYQSEADKPLTPEMRSKLMSQYPLDWSGYPPSSSQFQAGMKESFQNATPTVPDDAQPYQNISGSTMSPPDTGSAEAEERKILMTYQPKFPPGATSYDPEDIKGLVERVYAVKGLKPEIRQRGDSNVYDIINTHKIGEDVKMEPEPVATGDQAPASSTAVAESGEGTASEKVAGFPQDRFFDSSNPNPTGNTWDYTAWTPGLERSFAPTNPTKNWW
jgi:hypothetical protein